MDFLPEEFDEILNIFRSETEEIIQKINNNLLQLENSPNDKEILVYLFRDAHSLKGAARMIGFNNIQRLAHKIEDVLGLAKENSITINKEFANALYCSTDILSDLIQKSVKQKKEYYTDEIQNQITQIDKLIEKHQIKSQIDFSNEIVRATPFLNPKTKEFSQNVLAINAMLTESFLLLDKCNDENSNSYIETFTDLIKQLSEKFSNTNYYDIKTEISNITEKMHFVMENSKELTNNEIVDIKERIENIIIFLNQIYAQLGIELFDYKITLAKKQSDDNKAKKEEKKEEDKTTSDNSALAIFVKKIDLTKSNITNLEQDLSNIAEIIEALNTIIELSHNPEAIVITQKIIEIIKIIQKTKTLPQKETVNILKQSLDSIEKLTFYTKEEIDDSALVEQRLDIIKQMLDLNTSINPLANLSTTLNETIQPIKKSQDFFNSFESTSIRTLRVETKKLDALVNQIGELIIARIKQKKNTTELENIIADVEEIKNFNNKSQSFIKYFDKKHFNNEYNKDYSTFSLFYKQMYSILQENTTKLLKLSNRLLSLQKSVDEEDTKQALIINNLENMIKNTRVLPLATIFHMFPRMIRDISADTGKEIELLVSGSETSADKKIIEEIKAPLMHIIRNSIDHGIELPEERVAVGKPPKGKIYLAAKNSQNKIIIEIHDDGRGIDIDKILNRALEKNLITPKEASYLTPEQIMNIIFWAGFSTEQVVTEISGRGVGLDIVQTKINQLNGTVKVFSVPKKGTKITIELPISMSTLKAFIVQSAGQLFALSMTSIKNVMWINDEDIYIRNTTKTILFNNENINIFYLSELLNLPEKPKEKNTKKTVVIIEIENSMIGIVVDKILGDQNILQKKLEPPILKLKNISGITTLATGEVCLILNIIELYKSTYSPVEKPLIKINDEKKKIKKNPRILVVDDSITTRNLLKNVFTHNDYEFEMVHNPKEALLLLEKTDFDIILSDMEMPEMNGKIFVETLKSKEKYHNIPIIIISSYDTEKLKEEIPKANAIIPKSEFNQQYLLKTIEKLTNNDQ